MARTSRLVTAESADHIRISLMRGERALWFSPTLARPRLATVSPRTLSAREVHVLALVALGQSNKEIGRAMELSPLTIKSHLARISRKLGTGDRAGMVAIATRAGLI